MVRLSSMPARPTLATGSRPGAHQGGQSKTLAKFSTAAKAALGVTRFGRFREADSHADGGAADEHGESSDPFFAMLKEQAADLEQVE